MVWCVITGRASRRGSGLGSAVAADPHAVRPSTGIGQDGASRYTSRYDTLRSVASAHQRQRRLHQRRGRVDGLERPAETVPLEMGTRDVGTRRLRHRGTRVRVRSIADAGGEQALHRLGRRAQPRCRSAIGAGRTPRDDEFGIGVPASDIIGVSTRARRAPREIAQQAGRARGAARQQAHACAAGRPAARFVPTSPHSSAFASLSRPRRRRPRTRSSSTRAGDIRPRFQA